MGNAIKAGDLRLARIDVSVLGFLAREDIVPIELPSNRAPLEVAVPKEEIASSRLSFEVEIGQFRLEEEGKEQEEHVIQVSDSEGELNKSPILRSPKFIIARVDDSFEEEEEMALNRKKGRKSSLRKGIRGPLWKGIRGRRPRTP